jgi:hypothetical protein
MNNDNSNEVSKIRPKSPVVKLHQYTLQTPFGLVNIERVSEAMMREAEEITK